MEKNYLLNQQERISTKNKLTGEKIVVLADESEINVKKIVNMLNGSVHEPENLFLWQSKVCHMVNQQVVSRLMDHAIKSIACKREDFLLTDAARYMVATGKTLRELFPNLHHVLYSSSISQLR